MAADDPARHSAHLDEPSLLSFTSSRQQGACQQLSRLQKGKLNSHLANNQCGSCPAATHRLSACRLMPVLAASLMMAYSLRPSMNASFSRMLIIFWGSLSSSRCLYVTLPSAPRTMPPCSAALKQACVMLARRWCLPAVPALRSSSRCVHDDGCATAFCKPALFLFGVLG